MRPLRLDLQGFTTYREPVSVDFRGADLFALSGPTGAGKSSVIDALTFALYGAVARHGDQESTTPLISTGLDETRVRFDFTVGTDRYRVSRVVHRDSGGTVIDDARLECIGEDGRVTGSLAGDPAGVRAAVTDLLGLTFDDFNLCVVSPQGDFARFLHADTVERQALLTRLLGFGTYQRMGELATQRAFRSTIEIEAVDRRIGEVADATPEARRELDRRLGLVRRLVERIEEAQPTLDDLAAAAGLAQVEATAAHDQAALLARLAMPANVDETARKARAAAHELDEQARLVEVAALALEQAEAAFDDQVDRSSLEAVVRDHEERDTLVARLLAIEADRVVARTREGEAREAVAGAEAALEQAEADLRAAERRALAQDLVAMLEAGGACPVCEQVVTQVPAAHPTDPSEAHTQREAARIAATAAAAAQAGAGRALDKVEITLAEVRARLDELDEDLEGHPSLATAKPALEAHRRSARDLDNARAADREARARRDKATTIGTSLSQIERDLRKDFDLRRDALASVGPPPAGGEDLAEDWRDLVAWATEQRPDLDTAAAEAEAAALAAQEQRAELVERIDEFCRGVDIDRGEREPLVVAVEERARVEAELATFDEALSRRAALEVERDTHEQAGAAARALMNHLAPDRFERWALDEALALLVAGANTQLASLTDGSYSLAQDEDRGVIVVDHAHGDAVRSARSLSGGETFLVSLALALALADQVASHSASGAVTLEALFLDEGFGSLDADRLDTVASAIEGIGAEGRVVGVVTHVRSLADRLPTRFEVRKGPGTSTVERFDR